MRSVQIASDHFVPKGLKDSARGFNPGNTFMLKPQAESLSPFGTQFDRLLRDRIRTRIHIGHQIIYYRLRSDLGFLHRTLNFLINSY